MTKRYRIGLWLLAAFYVAGGTGHFVLTPFYVRIMPPMLPAPLALVYISGVAEILGGLGVLYGPTRRFAAWGLVALLIAVFPANVYMAVAHLPFAGLAGKSWVQWGRLPLQIPLLWWAWLYTKRTTELAGR